MPGSLSALYIHGPGGQGKSRLAAEIADLSAAAGWKAVHAIHVAGKVLPPPGAQDLSTDRAKGLMLIVDYADRWPVSHLAWLFSNALLHGRLPTRVLLLGRSAQSVTALRATLEELDVGLEELVLQPLPAGTDQRNQMFTAARDAFAARLGVADPSVIKPPGSLEHEQFGLTLAVHMAALAAVDMRGRENQPPGDVEGLSAYLLQRERLHWTRLYEGHTQGVDFRTPPSVMERAVFTAALTGTMPYADGSALLRTLQLDEIHPDRVLADHGICYPASARDLVLEPIYPDRLAEDYLALTLPGHLSAGFSSSAWAGSLMETLLVSSSPHADRAITFLAAAAGRWPHVGVHLGRLLSTHPELAVEGTAGLTAVAELQGIGLDVLEAIYAHLPESGRPDLNPGIAAIARRVTQHRLAQSGDAAEHAALHHGLAFRLAGAGQRQEAAAESELAVACYRRAQDQQPINEAELARALDNCGAWMSAVGRHAQALAASEEALTIWHRLAPADPGESEFAADVAVSLSHHATVLSAVGRETEALAAAEQALSIRERLQRTSVVADSALAFAYDSVGIRHARLGQNDRALTYARLAVTTRLQNLRQTPDTDGRGLAISLNNLARALAAQGDHTAAVSQYEEALIIYRRLAAVSPAANNRGLARTLHNKAVTLAALHEYSQAVSAADEAVALRRQLADSNPGTHRRELARSLESLSARLWEIVPPVYGAIDARKPGAISARERALAPLDEAVTLYRAIAEEHGHRGLEDLARAVETSAQRRWDTVRVYRLSSWNNVAPAGDDQAMVTASEEAVALYRQLAAASPEAHRRDLARVLTDLMWRRWNGAVNPSPALAAVEEAIPVYRILADEDPDEYRFKLASALRHKSILLGFRRDTAAAIAAAEEAITECLTRASIEPKAWRLLADLRLSHGHMTGNPVPTDPAEDIGEYSHPVPLGMPPKPPGYPY